MNTATETRELVTFNCDRCGFHLENFLLPSDLRRCLDCKGDDDREVNGWTPWNSRD